jgi:hypothetical protein
VTRRAEADTGDEARHHGRYLAGPDALLQRLALLLREVAGGDRRVDACDHRVLDRALEPILADAETLRHVAEEIGGGIARSDRPNRGTAAEHHHRRRSCNCDPSRARHRPGSPFVRPSSAPSQANLGSR